MINNDGKIVHTWKSKYLQGLPVHLLENGSLLRADYGGIEGFTFSGGVHGRVEMFDWDGKLIWEFKHINNIHCLHNDIKPLPNGNILMISREKKAKSKVIDAGRNPNSIYDGAFLADSIIEVEPTFPKGGKIVWKWSAWDHLIQDYDPTKENYGSVEDHPELIDINFRTNPTALQEFKWKIRLRKKKIDLCHLNSIDYHEEFDQILLSAKHFNGVWVIDHSTTIEEAAGHTGGRYGKGGDLLYRWGNPQTYRVGNEDDQKFFRQHDARWIDKGCPGEGHITIFNNGRGRPGMDYSSVEEIVPPVDIDGNYSLEPGSAYGPEEPIWIYTHKNPRIFYSAAVSSAQRLPNGNTLICSGWRRGIFLEVTYEKETVWKYINLRPFPGINNVFKIQRYPSNYPGLSHLTDKLEE